MRRPRIAVAGVYHESNTFARSPTPLASFRLRFAGNGVSDAYAGTQTVLGGFLAGAQEAELEPVPVAFFGATPSGPLEQDAFDAIVASLAEALRSAAPLDGLLLELHGALVAEGVGSGDGLLALAAREAVGNVPIVAVLDPHANLEPDVAIAVDAVLAYQANPHLDMAERGREGAVLLARILRERLSPVIAVVSIPVIAPAIAQATAEQPLASLVATARSLRRERGLLSTSMFFGFSYADVLDLGMSAVAVGESLEAASEVAVEIARHAWATRDAFARTLVSADEAVEDAARSAGLTALADTGDNVGGGAPGDSTVLASSLLAHGGMRAATTIWDPAAVEVAATVGRGNKAMFTLGSPPLTLSARVRHIGCGSFVNDGPLSAGVRFDMGRVAVLDSGPLTVVVQTHAVMANDQNMLRSTGLDLDSLDVVVLKGAAAVRAGWATRARRFIDVATPGPTTSDLFQLSFQAAKRPLWPLDEFEWRPDERDVILHQR